MARVLLVDDDAAVLRSYARFLTADGHEVDCANDVSEARDLMRYVQHDAIVTDVSMPGLTGIEFLRIVRVRDLDIPVIVMTGDPTIDTAMNALEFGAFRYLKKPLDQKTLIGTVNQAILLHRMAKLKREALELSGVEGKSLGDRASLEGRFTQALEKLWIAYQPIVSWGERRVVAYEALVRSDEPTLARPLDILDAAERLGQLVSLGRTIRAKVARDVTEAPADADLFVNLHARDLQDDQLYAPSSPLAEIGQRVVLEITERAPLESLRTIEMRMLTLRSFGFRLAVDDLGAGYAGLTSLVQLDPEVLKIDMSLVRDVDTNPTKRRIVSSITSLAKELKKKIVAEGVETAGERDVLHAIGCDYLQGYLFAKPARGFMTPPW